MDTAPIAEYFKTQPVLRAWLFGSYADGTATEDSDVDILVELDYSQHIGLGYFDILWGLEQLLNKKVDLVDKAGLSKHIEPYVKKQQQLIYER